MKDHRVLDAAADRPDLAWAADAAGPLSMSDSVEEERAEPNLSWASVESRILMSHSQLHFIWPSTSICTKIYP